MSLLLQNFVRLIFLYRYKGGRDIGSDSPLLQKIRNTPINRANIFETIWNIWSPVRLNNSYRYPNFASDYKTVNNIGF